MKSAFEKAMEKFDSEEIREFTPEQKKQLEEVDAETDAKIAQVKIRTDSRLQSGDVENPDQMRRDLALEIQALNEKRERQKAELKRQFTKKDA